MKPTQETVTNAELTLSTLEARLSERNTFVSTDLVNSRFSMDNLQSYFQFGHLNNINWKFCKPILVGATVFVGAKLACYMIGNYRTFKKAASSKAYPKDTVILHQFPRAIYAPSLSPYPMKVETYLRINKIPYQNDFSKQLGARQKSPWITFNGEEIDDSQMIIEYLNKKFDIDMNSHLSPYEKASVKGIRHMLEDHLYWTAVYNRWVKTGGQAVLEMSRWPTGLKGKLMLAFVRRRFKDQCWQQGMGRYTLEQISAMTEQDMRALSDFLGDKKYITGDELCEEDCVVFSFVAQAIYNRSGATEETEKILNDCENISRYCDRIKLEYWKDWDSLLKKRERN